MQATRLIRIDGKNYIIPTLFTIMYVNGSPFCHYPDMNGSIQLDSDVMDDYAICVEKKSIPNLTTIMYVNGQSFCHYIQGTVQLDEEVMDDYAICVEDRSFLAKDEVPDRLKEYFTKHFPSV